MKFPLLTLTAVLMGTLCAQAAPSLQQFEQLPHAFRLHLYSLIRQHAHNRIWKGGTNADYHIPGTLSARSSYNSGINDFFSGLNLSQTLTGGYLVLTERDIFGDSRPEQLLFCVFQSPGYCMSLPEPTVFVLDAEGRFRYTVPYHLCHAQKHGESSRGQLVSDGTLSTWLKLSEKEGQWTVYEWRQWELKPGHAQEVTYLTYTGERVSGYNATWEYRLINREETLYTAVGSNRSESVWEDSHGEEYSQFRAKIHTLAATGTANTPLPDARHYIAPLAESLFSSTMEWYTARAGQVPQALEEWNSCHANTIESSNAISRESAMQKLQQELNLTPPSKGVVPLFNPPDTLPDKTGELR